MADFKPDLPPDVKLPAGASINVQHEDYRKLETLAREEGWSQKSFSRVLGLEVSRSERARAAAPAPVPAPAPAPARPFSSLTTAEKFAAGLNNPPKRG